MNFQKIGTRVKKYINNLLQKTKTTFFDVVYDFWSSIIHANDLIIYSSNKSIIIFTLVVLLVFFALIFNSNSQVGFYTNFLRVLLVSFATFFVFCLSDYFWFLIKRNAIYKWNIKHKKRINILLERKRKEKSLDEKINFEKEIISTATLNSKDYKYHAKRYAIEICFLLFILLYIDPLFFVFNLFLFCGMFIYIFLYEEQSVDQAFDGISTLLYCIDSFNRENPEKCKRLILNNERKEIRELINLYKAVLKTT